ncbi:helix-turn-helix domain-containing protein [Rhizobium mesoamericanum]|uniref:helix-turn-helix domain-containing protein n=1 Tax=Rhizobium mesoamericanum TaxID=1079800 RepID=UPI0027D7E003|nr:helix-turn-helix transcriptional regulator [Rhizobium mesoamericanum]
MTSFDRTLYQRLIELLVEARRKANVTQLELGRRVGQRQTVISKIETEERRLDAAEFLLVSRAIGVDPYELMRRAETDCGSLP